MNDKNVGLLITSTGWGGLEMNVLKLAESLIRLDYKITLITQKKSTVYKKSNNIFKNYILLDNFKKYFDFKSARYIKIKLKENNIKTVIVFDNRDIDVISWTKRLFFKNLKIVYQQQMQIGVNKRDFIHTFRFKSIDVWVSPLPYLIKEIKEQTRFPVNRVVEVPICIDTSKFTDAKLTQQEALKELNIKPKAPLLGIIGRISEKKGQLFVVESLIRLLNKGINVELLIFGSATVNDAESHEYYKKLIETVKENKLEGVVHFIKHQANTIPFYKAIDVFVLGSHSETFGMVTVEAMLTGKPIVATRSGGTTEILEYGKLGYLYEYENYSEFTDQIEKVLNNMSEAKKIADNARTVAKTKYDLKVEINEFDKILKNL